MKQTIRQLKSILSKKEQGQIAGLVVMMFIGGILDASSQDKEACHPHLQPEPTELLPIPAERRDAQITREEPEKIDATL